MKNFEYDLIVIGGGTSGTASAISAARKGAKTLLLEKNSFLGGAMSAGMVMPMMNNVSFRNKNFEDSLLCELLDELYKTDDALKYKDGNPGWFNPEKIKYVLEKLAIDSGVEILFDALVVEVEKKCRDLLSLKVLCRGVTYSFSAKYFIDATADGNVAFMSGADFESGKDGLNQFMSLRFELGGVDVCKFANWMEQNSINDDISNVYRKKDGKVFLSLGFVFSENGCSYEKINEIIKKALKNKDINIDDINYVQFFSVPAKSGVLSFNCPRINKNLNPLSIFDTSKALIEGRRRILNLVEFFRKYFCGFENCFLSSCATELGIRDSRRIKTLYTLKKEDIINGKTFENPLFESDYPIDVHQSKESILPLKQTYSAPMQCTQVKGFDNLFVIGRCIGADFYAQAALRIQPNCFLMGEKLGDYVCDVLRNDTLSR